MKCPVVLWSKYCVLTISINTAVAMGTIELMSMANRQCSKYPSMNATRNPNTTVELTNTANVPRRWGSLTSPMYASMGASWNPMPIPMIIAAVYSVANDLAECMKSHPAMCVRLTIIMLLFRPSEFCKQPDTTLLNGWHNSEILPWYFETRNLLNRAKKKKSKIHLFSWPFNGKRARFPWF